MKLIRKIGLILAIVLIALAALPVNVCLAQGATISVNGGNTITLDPGQSTNVSVRIGDIPDLGPGNGVGAFTFDLSWDNGVINVTSVNPATIAGWAIMASPSPYNGSATITGFSMGTYITGGAKVATLDITAVGSAGSSTTINISVNDFGDKDGQTIEYTTADAPVEISAPPVEYTLTITEIGNGSTTGTGTYSEGAVVDVSANPDAGWGFVNWTGNTSEIADVNDPTTTITMNDDYAITANFTALPQYYLTMDEDGGGTTSGAGTYYQGQRANIRANPADGWVFDNWSGDTDTIDDVDDPTTTIVMNDNYSITANFSETETFTLTIAINGNGSTSLAVGNHQYQEGEEVVITAIPNEGWQFVNWSGDVTDPNSASTTVVINSDKTVIANFSPEGVTTHILTISINGQGITSPPVGTYTYAEGTIVDISANPENGWQFVNWSGDTGTIDDINDPTTTITMNSEYTITGNFSELPQYTLTIDVNGEGTTSGAGTYYQGEEVNIQANPASDWKFAFWSGETGTIDDINASIATIIMNDDHAITANFSEAEIFTLTMVLKGNGGTNPTVGEHGYLEGAIVNIEAIPDQEWQFVNWTGDVADPNSASTTVTINSDKTVTANFSQIGVTTYTLTITVNGSGSTSPSVGNHEYAEDEVIDISAASDASCQFVNWTGDVADPNSASTTVTINSDKTVTANFSQIDISPPVVIGIATSNITKTEADIAWITEEPSDSQVEYWASPSQLTTLDEKLVTLHLVHLTDLTPATTYRYKVMSRDETGNLAVSEEQTFITPGLPATFVITDWDLSLIEVHTDEEITVCCSVTNTGDLTGSYIIEFRINDVVEEVKEIILDGGASEDITFTTTKGVAGTYMANVAGLTFPFVIRDLASLPQEKSNWWLTLIIIAGMIFITTSVILFVRKQKGGFSFGGIFARNTQAGASQGSKSILRDEADIKAMNQEVEQLAKKEAKKETAKTKRATKAEGKARKSVHREVKKVKVGAFGEGVKGGTYEKTWEVEEANEGNGGLIVTKIAQEKLKEALQAKIREPGTAYRIVPSPLVPNQVKMILDKEKDGDQVLGTDGIKIILISPEIAPMLKGMVINYIETGQDRGLTISKSSIDI